MLSTPAYISSVSNCLVQLDCWLALRPKRSMMCHTDSSNLLVLARCIIHSLCDTAFFPDAVRRNTKSQREPTIKTLFEFYCTVGEESLPYMHYADMNPHSSKLYYILQICGVRVRERCFRIIPLPDASITCINHPDSRSGTMYPYTQYYASACSNTILEGSSILRKHAR